tara:strand:+ start:610 stop:747 length:138 start_codon:yes stop_codon:yes gene_type:complete
MAIITRINPRNFSKNLKKVRNWALKASLVKIYESNENHIKVANAI